jgi:hypothetical protein
MTSKLAAVLFGSIAMAAPLQQPFESTATQRVSFPPGGAIDVTNSYGYLTVEGWDEPEVEITVTKSTNGFYPSERKDQAMQAFDQIRVAAERRSDKELAISTTLPARRGFPFSLLPPGRFIVAMPKSTKRGVTVEYTVHAPRDSRLTVHQDTGYVWVSDVTGDIEVDSHTGDMIVMLPGPGPYAIDARTGMGSISSDLTGRGNKTWLVGSRFVNAGPGASRRVVLRMGRGCITIKNGPPSGPLWRD